MMIRLRKTYQAILLLFFSCLAGVSISVKKTYATTRLFSSLTKKFNKVHFCHPLYYKNVYRRYLLPMKVTSPIYTNRLPIDCHGGYRSILPPCIPHTIFRVNQRNLIQPSQAEDDQYKHSHSTIGFQKINFIMAPEAEDLFIGRTSAINTLTPYFAKQDNLVILPPITGDAGLGKTQLVHKLITQHTTQYEHIIWIDATTIQDIEESYHQIGAALGIAPVPDAGTQQVIAQVQDQLKDKQVLYVFDNATDLQTIQSYLKNGHILITSRNNTPIDWQSPHYDAPLSLDPFSERDTLHLAENMGYDTTDKSLLELIQLVPKYPLVIVQLLRDMSAHEYTPQVFLDQIKQNTTLMQQLKVNPQHYITYEKLHHDTIKSRLETLQSMKDSDPLIHLLQQMACLDHQPIPLSFVLLALGEEEVQTRHLLSTLAKHGLIRLNRDTVHMHSVTQTIIGDLKPLIPTQVANLVDRYVRYDIGQVASKSYPTENFWNQIIPHGEKLLNYVSSQRGEDVYTARCYAKLSCLYGQQGNDQQAIQLGQNALKIFRQVYDNQPHTEVATSYNNISSAYHRNGDDKQAMEYAQKALEIHKKVCGDQPHADIATAYNNIGLAYYGDTDYDQALHYYQTALEMYKKVYGDQPHTHIATAYNNVGLAYYSKADYDQALQYYQTALDMLNKVYHQQPHPYIAISYNNIGGVYDSQKDYDRALQYYHMALSISKKVYGDQPHADSATAYNNIGATYKNKEAYDQALEYYHKSLDILNKVYGQQPHPDIATAYSNIAFAYDSKADYDQALRFYQMTLEMRKKIYGDQPHAHTATAYHNIGLAYYHKGKYDQALQFYQTALEMRKKIYGDQRHPHLANSYHNIGTTYYQQKKYDQALQSTQIALGMYKKIYGNQSHPHLFDCYYNMAIIYFYQWNIIKSISFHRKARTYHHKHYDNIPALIWLESSSLFWLY